MPQTSLADKMKLKSGLRTAIINAPDGYLEELGTMPDGVVLAEELDGIFDWVQIFVQNQAELAKLAPQAIHSLKPEGMLWLSFPKGSSKIQMDLTRDIGWDTIQQADLKWINLISVNDTWSAFALRHYKPGEKRQSFR